MSKLMSDPEHLFCWQCPRLEVRLPPNSAKICRCSVEYGNQVCPSISLSSYPIYRWWSERFINGAMGPKYVLRHRWAFLFWCVESVNLKKFFPMRQIAPSYDIENRWVPCEPWESVGLKDSPGNWDVYLQYRRYSFRCDTHQSQCGAGINELTFSYARMCNDLRCARVSPKSSNSITWIRFVGHLFLWNTEMKYPRRHENNQTFRKDRLEYGISRCCESR